ncbi:M23 family metallopeptidase [Microbacterium sp. 1P10UB]|uniref:M23 family metallopeptidase n=1 Tax=unclassified Microbacterium TaxID=2609290 RepID=UPI0039A0B396
MSVLGLVAMLTVGMTVDAEALPHEHTEPGTTPVDSSRPEDIQAYVTPEQTQATPIITRDSYSTATLVDLAGNEGITNYSSAVFTNNPDCTIQWPYAVGVPMTYGFGMRDGKMHEGTDFVPGAGAHIQAIADGVVSTSTENGGAYGVTVVINHLVDGQLVSTRYAHMEYGSRQVEAGDTVSVGQYVGRTGNTGRSFGAHLHLEVLKDGTTAIDPLPWLKEHSAC